MAESELKHCIAPLVRPDPLVLFKAMPFGFKGAPLIMGRLAGAMTRQWQSAMGGKPSLQTYMGDPLMVVAGDQKVFGINLAYEKGERGTRVVWIGVTIEVDQDNKQIIISVPQKLVDEVLSKMQSWAGMASVREFRAVTGKLSWIAGILPRSRWAVSSFYAALADVEQESKDDEEVERAEKRQGDQRPKRGLIAVKRVELARRWLTAYLQQDEAWRCRKIPLVVQTPQWAVTTDASPFGVGAILSASGGRGHGRAHSHSGVSGQSDSKRGRATGDPIHGGCRSSSPRRSSSPSGIGGGHWNPHPELGGSRDGHRGPAADAGRSGTSPARQVECGGGLFVTPRHAGRSTWPSGGFEHQAIE